MKKVIIFVMLFAFIFCGCGVDSIKDANETLGFGTKTKEERAQEIRDSIDPLKDGWEGAQEKRREADYIENEVAATKEIKKASLNDFLFQIEDIVFSVDFNLTVDEFIAQFPDNYETEDDLNQMVEHAYCGSVYLCNKNNPNCTLVINPRNLELEDRRLGDCNVVGVNFDKCASFVSVYAPQGIPLNRDGIVHDDSLSKDNILDTLEKLNIPMYNFGDEDMPRFSSPNDLFIEINPENKVYDYKIEVANPNTIVSDETDSLKITDVQYYTIEIKELENTVSMNLNFYVTDIREAK